MNINQIKIYKKEIAIYYSRRSKSYDNAYENSAWHDRMARKLVDFANINTDDQVLDIGTGTGMVAFYAASKLGSHGRVIGIDISEGMIEKAQLKLRDAQVQNVCFELGDGEALSYAIDSFDYILCGSAFTWMVDLQATLIHWRTRLRLNGKIGFHAFSEDSFVTGVVAQSVLQKYGVSYLMNKPIGTIEKCQKLLEESGFTNIEVKVDKDGAYISLEEAKNSCFFTPTPAPGQFPHPLSSLTTEQLTAASADYEKEIKRLNTQNGIWNDMTTFYVFGEK